MLSTYLEEEVAGEEPRLVLLGLSAEAGDAVVAEGLRVLIYVPRIGRSPPLRPRRRRRAAARGALRL